MSSTTTTNWADASEGSKYGSESDSNYCSTERRKVLMCPYCSVFEQRVITTHNIRTCEYWRKAVQDAKRKHKYMCAACGKAHDAPIDAKCHDRCHCDDKTDAWHDKWMCTALGSTAQGSQKTTPLICTVCGSKDHWYKDCPDKLKKSDDLFNKGLHMCATCGEGHKDQASTLDKCRKICECGMFGFINHAKKHCSPQPAVTPVQPAVVDPPPVENPWRTQTGDAPKVGTQTGDATKVGTQMGDALKVGTQKGDKAKESKKSCWIVVGHKGKVQPGNQAVVESEAPKREHVKPVAPKQKPVAEMPTTEKSAAVKLVTGKPAAANPDDGKPVAGNPAAEKPAAKPDDGNPVTNKAGCDSISALKENVKIAKQLLQQLTKLHEECLKMKKDEGYPYYNNMVSNIALATRELKNAELELENAQLKHQLLHDAEHKSDNKTTIEVSPENIEFLKKLLGTVQIRSN